MFATTYGMMGVPVIHTVSQVGGIQRNPTGGAISTVRTLTPLGEGDRERKDKQ
jgi:hypothetical protein